MIAGNMSLELLGIIMCST